MNVMNTQNAGARNTISLVQTLYPCQPGIKSKAMLVIGAIFYPAQTRRWLRFLEQRPALWALAKCCPQLIIKIYRPYLSRRMGCSDRVETIIQHYERIFETGFGEFIRRTALRPKTVCEFAGKSGTLFQLDITSPNLALREGELFLRLLSNGICLYRAAFIFNVLDGELYVKIGCVQGLRAGDGASFVRETTRDLHGCRPKNLMVSVIRDIGDYFGCKGMIGISNQNRVLAYGGRHQKTAPDYDQTWEELGAEKRADGDFQLSCVDILKTSFEDIPSRKRSEAKKRNALLDSIFQAVRKSLNEESAVLRSQRAEKEERPKSVP